MLPQPYHKFKLHQQQDAKSRYGENKKLTPDLSAPCHTYKLVKRLILNRITPNQGESRFQTADILYKPVVKFDNIEYRYQPNLRVRPGTNFVD